MKSIFNRLLIIARELKNGALFCFFYLIDTVLLTRSAAIRPKTLLIIRTDALGDYILFRNCLQAVRSDPVYRDWRIVLACNEANRPMAEALDASSVDAFIWVDRRKMSSDLDYRFKKLSEIRRVGFERCWYPAYGREYAAGDSLARVSGAAERWAAIGNSPNMPLWQRPLCNRIYNHKILVSPAVLFELDRNAEIASAFLRKTVQCRYEIRLPHAVDRIVEGRYAVIQPCVGGSRAVATLREWKPEFFAVVAAHLADRHGFAVLLTGVAADKAVAQSIRSAAGERTVIDLTGQTRLLDYLAILQESSVVVSGDTSAIHAAAAMRVPAVCISNGNHLGRFTQYPPPWDSWIRYVYSHGVLIQHPERYQFVSYRNINEVNPSDVCAAIDCLIEEHHSKDRPAC